MIQLVKLENLPNSGSSYCLLSIQLVKWVVVAMCDYDSGRVVVVLFVVLLLCNHQGG